MALINRPMYEHFGARHLGVKGPGALTQLEEGVMGVLPLDLSSDPMYWYIQGIRAFGKSHNEAAGGAGTYAKIGLSIENTNAQTVARIMGVSMVAPVTGEVEIYRCARTAFSSDPGIYGTGLDTRIPEAQQSQAVIINSADPSLPGTSIGRIIRSTAAQPMIFEMPLIVSPGEAIFFFESTVNTEMRIMLTWVEMPAYKAEL